MPYTKRLWEKIKTTCWLNRYNISYRLGSSYQHTRAHVIARWIMLLRANRCWLLCDLDGKGTESIPVLRTSTPFEGKSHQNIKWKEMAENSSIITLHNAHPRVCLRDDLDLIPSAPEYEELMAHVSTVELVYFVNQFEFNLLLVRKKRINEKQKNVDHENSRKRRHVVDVNNWWKVTTLFPFAVVTRRQMRERRKYETELRTSRPAIGEVRVAKGHGVNASKRVVKCSKLRYHCRYFVRPCDRTSLRFLARTTNHKNAPERSSEHHMVASMYGHDLCFSFCLCYATENRS